MLYGDDDTVFFIDNALEMLEGLDHNMPYFLTDNLWFPDQFGASLYMHDPQSDLCSAVCLAVIVQDSLGEGRRRRGRRGMGEGQGGGLGRFRGFQRGLGGSNGGQMAECPVKVVHSFW